jgi:hypothetical protein
LDAPSMAHTLPPQTPASSLATYVIFMFAGPETPARMKMGFSR